MWNDSYMVQASESKSKLKIFIDKFEIMLLKTLNAFFSKLHFSN